MTVEVADDLDVEEVTDPSALHTACVASSGSREGSVKISVVLLRCRKEFMTTEMCEMGRIQVLENTLSF